jgi:putative ABC transport system permease protein
MNLAIRDIRQDLGRFVLTTLGLGLLLTIVLAMTGIYNGMIVDATTLPDTLGADLWLV